MRNVAHNRTIAYDIDSKKRDAIAGGTGDYDCRSDLKYRTTLGSQVVTHSGMAMQMRRSHFLHDTTNLRSMLRTAQTACGALALIAAAVVTADEVSPPSSTDRQSLDDAWWTGPLLAASASTLPKGHALIEPYVYDVITRHRFDEDGNRHSTARTNSFGSLTYLLYGLTDKLTAGLIPTFGFNDVSGGEDSSRVGLGDITLQAQYRLTQFREGNWMPTMSLVLQETVPTGKHDHLGAHPGDGLGSGAYTTTLALYSQYYFWLPNGRILRTRLNVSQSFSDDANVEGVSVYGTGPGFRGHASPGDSLAVNSSWEYSVTRNWVLALDVYYQHDENTRVSGDTVEVDDQQRVSVLANSGSSWRIGFAPAIEYNWTSRVGVIVGARWVAAGRNVDATITPVAAINLVY